MLIIVTGKDKSSYLLDRLNEGEVVFDNFGVGLHPVNLEKLIDNLLKLPIDDYDIYLGTHDYFVVKLFGLLTFKNKSLQVYLYDTEAMITTKDFDVSSILDFSGDLYQQWCDLSLGLAEDTK